MDIGTQQKKEELISFLKQAFCIDGECSLKAGSSTVVSSTGEFIEGGLTFELNDSKRGKFHVTLSK